MLRPLLSGLAISALPAQPASAQPFNPTGVWRCIANSNIVSIDVTCQINPDYSLAGRGSIVYVNPSRIYQVQGYGRWSALPPDAGSSQWMFQFQMAPQNHAIFSVFTNPTGDTNSLYNLIQNPSTGAVVETSCARVG